MLSLAVATAVPPTHTHARTHVHTHMHAYTHMCTCTHTHIHVRTHTYARIYTHVCTHLHAYARVPVHTHTHVCTPACANTHTYTARDTVRQFFNHRQEPRAWDVPPPAGPVGPSRWFLLPRPAHFKRSRSCEKAFPPHGKLRHGIHMKSNPKRPCFVFRCARLPFLQTKE